MSADAREQFDWRSPASEVEKLNLIAEKCRKGWGDEKDTYLFYDVGEQVLKSGLTDDEEDDVIRRFFPSGKPRFGDVEVHKSSGKLRLRGILTLHPSLYLRDRYCPLWQIGHGGMPGINPDADMVNFHEEWKSRM